MIKTFYFDLGNVLVFFSRPKMIAQVAHCTGMSEKALKELFLGRSWLQAYETGQMDSLGLYQNLRAHAPKHFSLHELLHAASDIFTPNEELWPLVQELKAQGKRLVLLSNTCECHYNRIHSTYPILHLFDHKVLSFEVGACKPDPRIFKHALRCAECAPEECFYIDDIPAFIASAKRVGLKGVVYKDVKSLKLALTDLSPVLPSRN